MDQIPTTNQETQQTNTTYVTETSNAKSLESGNINLLNSQKGDDTTSDPSFIQEMVEPKKKKRGGRRKINIEFIPDKNRRHITFSKRKGGLMKKAYELSTLTGTQVILLVASETGHVYTFATPKLQALITKPEGKNLIQQCLNSTDDDLGDKQIVPQGYQQPIQPQQMIDPNQQMYPYGYQKYPMQVLPNYEMNQYQGYPQQQQQLQGYSEEIKSLSPPSDEFDEEEDDSSEETQ